jgi:cell shape-determining protein MreD
MIKGHFEKYALAFVTILFFVLEAKLDVFGIRPNLTLLPVYYVGLRKGPVKGALFGVLIGAIADSLAGNLLGPNMLAKGSAGILATFITGGFLRWTPFMGVIWLFAVTWADGILSYASLSVFAEAPTSIYLGIMTLFVQASVNTVAGYFIKPTDEH